ncbi:MAG: PsbP-related protein, partial [Halobacteriota archaeon]
MNRAWGATALIAVVLIAAIASAGCTTNNNINTTRNETTTVAPINTYTGHGFTMQYPTDWTKYEPGNGSDVAVVFALPTHNDTENLNVVTFAHPNNVSLASLVADATDQVQQFDNFTQVSARNTTLGGAPAYTVTYTATIGDAPLKVTQVWAIHNGTSYDVT